MDYQNFKVIEPVSFFKGVARESLRGRWPLAIVAGLLYVIILNIPVVIFDDIFGVSVNVSQYASMFGSSASEVAAALEAQGYGEDAVMTATSPISAVYTLLITGALALGFSVLAIHFTRRAEADAGMVFSGFSNYFRSLGVTVMIGLICMLWAMICVIPIALIATISNDLAGILILPLVIAAVILVMIIYLRYGMVYFILADNPKTGILECLRRSKMMMSGNKGKLFLLYLSFIGWYILCLLVMIIIGTAGVVIFGDNLAVDVIFSCITAVPLGILTTYMYVSAAAFYEKVSGISSGMFNLSENTYYEDLPPGSGEDQ